jgi:hypothetical protein
LFSYLQIIIPQLPTKKDLQGKKIKGELDLPSINAMISGHFSVKASARRKMERFFKKQIWSLQPPVFEKAVVTYELFRNVYLDEDNCYSSITKVCNDALVNIGIFKTDKYPHLHTVVLPQVKCAKEEQRIIITMRTQPTDDEFRAFLRDSIGVQAGWATGVSKSKRGRKK